MLSGVYNKRTKRPHHKTRTGCSTCKRGHFKCDEKKPSCLRCILAGKECEYNVPQTQHFPASPSKCSEASITPTPDAFEWHVAIEPREHRALVFFRERTAPKLTGYTSYTEKFWSSLVPKICQTEVGIRHIVIAIATKHEVLSTECADSDSMSLFWTRHHSLALSALSSQESPPSPGILLVSCIAFTAFERLHDPTGLGGRYIDYIIAGLSILRERSERNRANQQEDFNLIDNFIEPMFFQIELLLCMFCQPKRLVASSTQQYQMPCPDIPAKFASLESARDLMFQICAWRYTLSHAGRLWSTHSAAFQEIRSLMAKWYAALEAYLANLSPDDIDECKRANSLKPQMELLVGAMLYSARDVPPYCCPRPEIVDVSASRILIFIRIIGDRKVNLSGINTGRPADLKYNGIWLWPHAKRIPVQGGEDLVSFEFSNDPVVEKS